MVISNLLEDKNGCLSVSTAQGGMRVSNASEETCPFDSKCFQFHLQGRPVLQKGPKIGMLTLFIVRLSWCS